MSYTLDVKVKTRYLHLRVMGDNTAQNVESYLTDAVQTCEQYNCYNILLEEHLERPGIDTLDIFDIISTASSQRTMGVIAYVDTNPDHNLESMKFAENVAVNRGFYVRVLSSVSEAEEWLENELSA